MEYDKKEFSEIKKKFKKIPKMMWIYFMHNNEFKRVWFINYNKEDKYVLVKWPGGFLKKLYISEDKMYLRNVDYNKIFPKKKKKSKKSSKRSKKKISKKSILGGTCKNSKKLSSDIKVIKFRRRFKKKI